MKRDAFQARATLGRAIKLDKHFITSELIFVRIITYDCVVTILQ